MTRLDPPRRPVEAGSPAGDADPAAALPPASRVLPVARHGSASAVAARPLPEEVAVAVSYNGTSQAVMMATPADLEDFALGFSLTEGHVAAASEIVSLDVCVLEEGIDLRLWLAPGAAARFAERRRGLVGPTGCGLCGVESLAEALRPPARVDDATTRIPAQRIAEAMAAMVSGQTLRAETRAVHAAALWRAGEGIVALREDVGRHNALDKLVGAAERLRPAPSGCVAAAGRGGLLLLTSRVSVEMVLKAAVLGVPVMAAVSAPTALAVRVAEAAGITLVASARDDGFDVFTHADRIAGLARASVR